MFDCSLLESCREVQPHLQMTSKVNSPIADQTTVRTESPFSQQPITAVHDLMLQISMHTPPSKVSFLAAWEWELDELYFSLHKLMEGEEASRE